jgi:pyruvate dehydrogenase E1 component alpha subunit
MGTEVARASAVANIYEKGCAYDIANRQLNGQDIIEMYQNVDEALEYARKEGPVLLEALTYRYSGHSMGDPERYRSKTEIEEWRARDPIARLEDQMVSKGMADAATFEEIRRQAEAGLVEIVEFAEQSPEPEEASLCEFVYVDPIPHR